VAVHHDPGGNPYGAWFHVDAPQPAARFSDDSIEDCREPR
jgi:hypothetical protein